MKELNEMEKVMRTNLAVCYTLDEVMAREIVCYKQWADCGLLEDLDYETGGYYFFSNYYGSEGGYYNGSDFYMGWELDDMPTDDAEKIMDEYDFVEEPCIKEVHGLYAGYEYEHNGWGSGDEVLRDENGHVYRHGGLYQKIGSYFHPVELVEEDVTLTKKEVIDAIKHYGIEDEDGTYHLRYSGRKVELVKRTIFVDGTKIIPFSSVIRYPHGSAGIIDGGNIYA